MAEDVTIGVIANLTGSDVPSSVDMVRGVQLATDRVNAAGGVKGKQIKLIVEDSEYQARPALDAATKLYRRRHGVPAAVVFGGSSVTLPIAEMAAQKGRVIMNTSASSAKLGDFPGTIFSTLPLDDIVGKELGIYAAKKGAKTAVFIVPNNTFGTGLMEAAAASFTAAGGKVLQRRSPTPRASPTTAPICRPLQQDKPGCDRQRRLRRRHQARSLRPRANSASAAPWYVGYPSIFSVEDPAWMDGKLSGIYNGRPSGDACRARRSPPTPPRQIWPD